MDLNHLLDRHQRALMVEARADSDRERLVMAQHARAHADQIRATREALGACMPRSGAVT